MPSSRKRGSDNTSGRDRISPLAPYLLNVMNTLWAVKKAREKLRAGLRGKLIKKFDEMLQCAY
jgi:hypothetical protein